MCAAMASTCIQCVCACVHVAGYVVPHNIHVHTHMQCTYYSISKKHLKSYAIKLPRTFIIKASTQVIKSTATFIATQNMM